MPNDELLRLAERVEKLAGPDREVDCAISLALVEPPEGCRAVASELSSQAGLIVDRVGRLHGTVDYQPFTASLDAAMQLVPNQSEWGLYSPDTDAGESKFCCEISPDAAAWKAGRSAQASYAATPALALTAAALRARAHSGDTQ